LKKISDFKMSRQKFMTLEEELLFPALSFSRYRKMIVYSASFTATVNAFKA
jgi:hypothetical protein